jgi:hypothetical protein
MISRPITNRDCSTGDCNGAASHRFTYSSTQGVPQTASTALTMRSHGTVRVIQAIR